MSLGQQYYQFFSIENFKLAYMRIKTSARDQYKEFYYEDFKLFELYFDDNISQLIHEVKEGIYSPSSCEKYFMPKKNNLARPMTMLTLLDQILYQAIANVIADICHSKLKKYFNINTFGNIFKHTQSEKSIFFYEGWKNQWKKYNQQKKRAFDYGFEYCADFDIASFYDTIDHGILKELLKEFRIDDFLIDLLLICLSTWTTSSAANLPFSKSCGIPQGPVSSAFLAEIYLFPLDGAMRKHSEVRYFRYADDINIMAKTEEDCRKMVVYLDLFSRDLSLIPQAGKIEVGRILDIDAHIKTSNVKFSKIVKEYKGNYNQLLKLRRKKLRLHLEKSIRKP